MLIASVSSAAFLLVTDLSIIELDQGQLIAPQVETTAAVEAAPVKADEDEVAKDSHESVEAVAASWAKDAVKRRRVRD
jgi:hypothetical protein